MATRSGVRQDLNEEHLYLLTNRALGTCPFPGKGTA